VIAATNRAAIGRAAQPNDLDRRRIERALAARQRYRWVKPRVVPMTDGYRIESPCCSRRIDTEGGIIDIALLLFDEASGQWILYRKDHATETWQPDSIHRRLADLLEALMVDPRQTFWQ
jgi:hypothetical protein